MNRIMPSLFKAPTKPSIVKFGAWDPYLTCDSATDAPPLNIEARKARARAVGLPDNASEKQIQHAEVLQQQHQDVQVRQAHQQRRALAVGLPADASERQIQKQEEIRRSWEP